MDSNEGMIINANKGNAGTATRWFECNAVRNDEGELVVPAIPGVKVAMRPLKMREITAIAANEGNRGDSYNAIFMIIRLCLEAISGVKIRNDNGDLAEFELEFSVSKYAGRQTRLLSIECFDKLPNSLQNHLYHIAGLVQEGLDEEGEKELGFTPPLSTATSSAVATNEIAQPTAEVEDSSLSTTTENEGNS